MKLSLAAVLLGQTVPALSKRSSPIEKDGRRLRLTTDVLVQGTSKTHSTILDEQDNRRKGRHHNRRLKHKQTRTMKNDPSAAEIMVPCDPKSTDADVGILSCGMNYVCEPSSTSSLGGVCSPLKSAHRDSTTLPRNGALPSRYQSLDTAGRLTEQRVPCDPTLIDVGILACEGGQYCQHDETSETGGFCVDSFPRSSRRLAILQDYLYQCEPDPVYGTPAYCDCSKVDMTTGTGTIYCEYDGAASYVQGCDEYVVNNYFSYTFQNSVLVKLDDCYKTSTPFAEEICFQKDYANSVATSCATEWNGQPCTSCNIVGNFTTFDCSNLAGGKAGDWWTDALSVIPLCSNSTCRNVCGDGKFIPDYNFGIFVPVTNYVTFSCQYLSIKEDNGLIFDAYCGYYSQAAQASCCVPMASPVPAATSGPVLSPAPTISVPAMPLPTSVPAVALPTDAPVPPPVPLPTDAPVTEDGKKEKSSKAPKASGPQRKK